MQIGFACKSWVYIGIATTEADWSKQAGAGTCQTQAISIALIQAYFLFLAPKLPPTHQGKRDLAGTLQQNV